MTTNQIVAIIGTTIVIQEFFHYLPQPLRIYRTRSIQGVSPSAVTLIAVMSVVWLSFAVWEQAWMAVAAGAVVTTFSFWTVTEVIKNGGNWHRMLRVGATATTSAAIVTGISLALGMQSVGLGALLLAATTAHGIPRLYVGLTSQSLRGLSATYLTFNVIDGALYGTYGHLIGVQTYVIFAFIQVLTSAPVLLRWVLRPEVREEKDVKFVTV